MGLFQYIDRGISSMNKTTGFHFAARANLVLYGLVLVFHILILIGIVFFDYAPIDFLWGGRMKSKEELLQFEIVGTVVVAICAILTLIHARYLDFPRLQIVARIGMWLLFLMFALNTLGNLLAPSLFEKAMAGVTALLSILSLRLATGSTSDGP